MALSYRHRQTNPKIWLLFASIAIFIVGAYGVATSDLSPWLREPWLVIIVSTVALLGALALAASVTAIFSNMTVEVTDRELLVGFALGVMRRRIPLTEIARVNRASIPWWYGYGLMLGWKRTTYLVAPGPAVAVELKSGRTVR